MTLPCDNGTVDLSPGLGPHLARPHPPPMHNDDGDDDGPASFLTSQKPKFTLDGEDQNSHPEQTHRHNTSSPLRISHLRKQFFERSNCRRGSAMSCSKTLQNRRKVLHFYALKLKWHKTSKWKMLCCQWRFSKEGNKWSVQV